MTRYNKKHIKLQCWNISSPIDARDLILPSFDAPHRDDSNEPSFVFLRSLDSEIFTFSSFFFEFQSFEKFKGFETSFEGQLYATSYNMIAIVSHILSLLR